MANLVDRVKSNGGEVCFVRITAPIDSLVERVSSVDRRKYQKMIDPIELKGVVSELRNKVIEASSHIDIDSSSLTPKESAAKIMEAFGISRMPIEEK